MSTKEEERLQSIEASIEDLEKLNSALQEMEDDHFPKSCIGYITNFTVSLQICSIICSGINTEEDKKQQERLDLELKKAKDNLEQAFKRTSYVRTKQPAGKATKLENTVGLVVETPKPEMQHAHQDEDAATLKEQLARQTNHRVMNTGEEISQTVELTERIEELSGLVKRLSKFMVTIVDELEELKEIVEHQQQQLELMDQRMSKREEVLHP